MFKILRNSKGETVVHNAKGEVVGLNRRESLLAQFNQRIANALGIEISITTLTTVIKAISEQKFFEVAPADYLPVVVGEGTWSTHMTTYKSFVVGDDFSTGIINQGANATRLAQMNAGVSAVSKAVLNWAKESQWNIMQLEQAAKSGNWDLVAAIEEARKRNWDLGIQKIAFLGLEGDDSVLGLLNQSAVNSDLTVLTAPISSLTGAQLKTFCATVLDRYRSNCNRTAWPTKFIMPESDFLGIAAPSSADFPLKSVKQVLEETFATMTGKKDFKIMPLSYADQEHSGLGLQRYVLLNEDPKSVRMDIPLDYTNTMANSVNSFSFQNVGYGQFTGVQALREQEMLYLDF